MNKVKVAEELVKIAKELISGEDWLNKWRRGNDKGNGYSVGKRSDSPTRAAKREGWKVIDNDIEGAVLVKKDDGKLAVIADRHGPWAVDI